LRLISVNETSNSNTIISPSIGTVDYTNGIISVNSINITSVVDSDMLMFTIKPTINDIESKYNKIVDVSLNDVKITIRDSIFN
jgi:hypothetical protein